MSGGTTAQGEGEMQDDMFKSPSSPEPGADGVEPFGEYTARAMGGIAVETSGKQVQPD